MKGKLVYSTYESTTELLAGLFVFFIYMFPYIFLSKLVILFPSFLKIQNYLIFIEETHSPNKKALVRPPRWTGAVLLG